MRIRQFNSLEEIQKYYDKDKNAYIFKEDGKYIDLVVFDFDLRIKADIYARDIKAHHIFALNIDAWDINAWDINAYNIEAWDIIAWNIKAINIKVENILKSTTINARFIRYHAICLAYSNIKCQSIKGRRDNAKHFVLNGKIEMLENGKLCEKDLDRLEKLEQENKELKEQVNHFKKVIEVMQNSSKLDCTHMFDNCKKLTPLTEEKEEKITRIEEALDKLGRYEDIEEEIGIDLITLFKALKNGFWSIDKNKHIYKMKPTEGNGGAMSYYASLDYIITEDTYYDEEYFLLKDYGKTWALTREALEYGND